MSFNCENTWIWLDLDDTLWDFRRNSVITLRQLYASEEDINKYFPSEDEWVKVYSNCNDELWRLYNRAIITKDFLKMERFRKPLSDAGYPSPLDKLASRDLDKKYLDILGSMDGMVPGAKELLVYLKQRGYHTGILSNGFHEVQHAKIKSSNINHLIDIIILSDDVGANKPHPMIFQHAMECAHTDAEHCIMIGDNADTDINGALGCGWKAIYFNPNAQDGTCPDTGVITVSSLDHIHALL